MIIAILIAVVLAMLAYVRLAPSDPERWHRPVEAETSQTFPGGAVRVAPGGQAELERLAQATAALPRTDVLAGTVAEGRITYVTRSKVFGFPDYTTIEQSDGQVRAHARLRFGYSDMGVNAARLDRIFAAAGL